MRSNLSSLPGFDHSRAPFDGACERLPIFFVIQGLGPGGAEKQLLLTARYLSELNYPCSVFVLAAHPKQPRIKALFDAAKSAGVSFYEPESYAASSVILRLANSLRQNRRVVLWSWGRRSDLVCKLMASFFKQAILVCSLRSAHRARARKFRLVDRLASSNVVRYVSNSWLSCEHLSETLPGVLPRCRVIYNCLDEHELRQAPIELPLVRPTPLHVVMLGNIAPFTKGYDHVLEVAQQIVLRRLPVQISIAGRDHYRNWLQDEIMRLNLAPTLRYYGEATNPYLYLRSGHAFLLMSRLEGTPNALLEAMNLGLPCISTKVGDVARLTTDGTDIRLVEIGDSRGVVSILEEFVSDWPAALQLGRSARELCATRFTPARLISDTIEMLAELSRERAPLPREGK